MRLAGCVGTIVATSLVDLKTGSLDAYQHPTCAHLDVRRLCNCNDRDFGQCPREAGVETHVGHSGAHGPTSLQRLT